MAMQISIKHNDQPLIYNVELVQEDIYIFRLNDENNKTAGLVPEKIIIRKKGKLWVSDVENNNELVGQMINEISSFKSGNL